MTRIIEDAADRRRLSPCSGTERREHRILSSVESTTSALQPPPSIVRHHGVLSDLPAFRNGICKSPDKVRFLVQRNCCTNAMSWPRSAEISGLSLAQGAALH